MKAIIWLAALISVLDNTVCAADNIACPEQIGAEVQACHNCGNEDTDNQAHCANKAFDGSQCGCNPTSVTAPLETAIVTAAPSGASGTVTGTYALATLTAFSNLRQSITTTVTVSPTQPGEPAATAAVVIFAGGVAWYLAGVVGGEAAVLSGPPNEAGGHPDDTSCPNPKSKCKDCGGNNGVCVSPNGGCACDNMEETCPEEKPKCSADTCKGDKDNKCTVENKGCDCEAAATCPDEKDQILTCDKCGGAEPDIQKCTDGNAPCCKGPENMGCACYHNDEGLLGFQIPFDVGKAQESWDQVVNGAHNDPTCEGQSVVNTNYFQNLYPEFCAQATNGKASDWTRGILPGENFGGYNFKFKATGGGTCQTCEYAFSKIMEKCGTKLPIVGSFMSNKGSIDVGCGSFSYEIVAPPEPPKPDTPVTCNPSDVPLGGWTAKSGYPAPAYKAGSHQYCYGNGQRYDWTATAGDSNSAANYFWFDTTTTDPSTNLPTYCLGSAKGEYNQWSPPSQKNCKATGEQRADSQIGLRVIPVKDQSGCQPLRDHKLPVDGDCTKIFDQVTDQCITGNPNDSAGFYLENGPDGCWEWWIYGMTRG